MGDKYTPLAELFTGFAALAFAFSIACRSTYVQ